MIRISSSKLQNGRKIRDQKLEVVTEGLPNGNLQRKTVVV